MPKKTKAVDDVVIAPATQGVDSETGSSTKGNAIYENSCGLISMPNLWDGD